MSLLDKSSLIFAFKDKGHTEILNLRLIEVDIRNNLSSQHDHISLSNLRFDFRKLDTYFLDCIGSILGIQIVAEIQHVSSIHYRARCRNFFVVRRKQ